VLGPFDPVTGDATSALLMISQLDGSGARRFSEPGTHGTTEDNVARFAPDGQRVVFVRDQPIDGVLHFALFRMRVDGTGVQQLTPWELNADRPSVSPARYGPTAGLVAFETFGGGNPGRGDIAVLPLGCRSLAACTRDTRLVTHNAGITSRQLCSALGIRPPNLVGMVNALEKRNLIERQPHPRDGRAMGLHLTPAGQKLMRDAEKTAAQLEAEAASRLSGTEVKTLIRLLQKVYL